MINVSSEKAKVNEMKKIVGYLEEEGIKLDKVYNSLLKVNEGPLINEMIANLDLIRIKFKNEIDKTSNNVNNLSYFIDHIYETEQAELMEEEFEC